MNIKSTMVTSIAGAGLIATQIICPTFALAASAQTVSQTGSGSTEVTVQLLNGEEVGGTSEQRVVPAPDETDPEKRVNADGEPDENGAYILNPLYNPDRGDGYGENLAFSVPSSINFVASADGTLVGPSPEAIYIENLSAIAIHASSFKVDNEGGWTIVDKDSTRFDAPNSVDFQFGPADDLLDAYDYVHKRDVGSAASWNMAPGTNSGVEDRVQMETGGHLHNVTFDIARAPSRIATIHTYITPGTSS